MIARGSHHDFISASVKNIPVSDNFRCENIEGAVYEFYADVKNL